MIESPAFAGKEIYPSLEEKAANLLYFVTKNHSFADGNKRLAITLCADFLLLNGYMAVAKRFFTVMENISYHVAAGHIDEELLRRILEAIMNFSYDSDEALKLDIFNAISVVDEFY